MQLIALGGNISVGNRLPEALVQEAVELLRQRVDSPIILSPLYRSPAFPAGSGPDYVNAAARMDVAIAPRRLLEILHDIEAKLGRARSTRWAARPIDLDLLAVGDQILPDPVTAKRWRDLPLQAQLQETPVDLILPHPRLQDRAFVLVPLCDIAPDWRHPALGRSVQEMRDALPAKEISQIVRIPAA